MYGCVRGFLDNTKQALAGHSGGEEVVPVTGLVYIQTTDLTLMDYLGISAGGAQPARLQLHNRYQIQIFLCWSLDCLQLPGWSAVSHVRLWTMIKP